MLLKLFRNKFFTSILAGVVLFLAYPKYNLFPLIFLFPLFTHALVKQCRTFGEGFAYGFLTSFIIMLGGFYWVVYVLHEFGYLPWAAAGLMYLGFCGFGALNFPLYTGLATLAQRRWKLEELATPWLELWHALGLPALFTIVEYWVPKLFPWLMGHSLYRTLWMTQIAEITGCTFLTFCIFSLGSMGGLAFDRWLNQAEDDRNGKTKKPLPRLIFWAIPLGLWTITISFSLWRLSQPLPDHLFTVALIQPNIGSLEKVEAKKGLVGKVRHVVDTYERLTESALRRNPKPSLIVWPETAMPFELEPPTTIFSRELLEKVIKWQVPLITGGYAASPFNSMREYNSAFLLEPVGDKLHRDLYNKNILLAFGEYMPFGEWFPSLYQKFPEVGTFEIGKVQNVFTLKDGIRLGVTICYEDIIPTFFRKVARNEVNAVVNITNDSWFGPTAEPYLHGGIAIFRAIETRLPLMRVTNTGTSFTVDSHGRMSELTPVYEEAVLTSTLHLPEVPPLTFYVRFGDWFILVCLAITAAFAVLFWRRNASLPLR